MAPRLPPPLPCTLWPRALGSRCGFTDPSMEGRAQPPGCWGQRGTGHECTLLFCSSSQEYQSAQASLTRSFQGKFDKFVVPCVVASGDTKDRKGTEPLSFRCGALGSGAGWSLSLPTATQIPVGLAQGLGGREGHMVPALPSANPRHSQSPQHAVPGAVVSSGGAVYRGDV